MSMYYLPSGVGGAGVGDMVTLVPRLLPTADEEDASTLGEGLTGETSAAENSRH